jgi:ABC-type sugar transport system ATPase subunit
MSLLDGGIVIDGVLRLDTIEIPLPDMVNAQTHPGQELIVGVRPQAARIAQYDQAAPEGIHVSGVVESLEPDFEHDSQLAYLPTGRLGYAASSSLDTPLQVGDACRVLFPMDHLHFFDRQTELHLG